MGWIRDRAHGFLDNFVYDALCRLFTALWPMMVPLGYFLLAKAGKLPWSTVALVVVLAAAALTTFLTGRAVLRSLRQQRKHSFIDEITNGIGVIGQQPAAPVQPIPPTPFQTGGIWQPFPDYSDPAYDRFWPSSWRDGLIKRGQFLVERWTTRLDYPEKQSREHESRNWLYEAEEYARQHLTEQQISKFTSQYNSVLNPSQSYDFLQVLIQAGTDHGSENANLAFEIVGKVKLLEQFRKEPMPPS